MKKKNAWIAIFAIIAFFYFSHASHDIVGGDVGDLVTTAYTHGIAHPPGYPLFTLFGIIFSKLPVELFPVTKIALVSVVSSLFSLFFFKGIISFFTKKIYFQIVAVLILSFSYLFWFYSEVPEVFALNTCLALGSVYFSLRFYYKKEFNTFLLSIFFFGLGFSNHMTIVFIAPLLMATIIGRRKELKRAHFRLLLIPIFFLLGLLPYLYLPIASIFNPVIEWNEINSFDSFMHHVLRRDYGTFSAGAFFQPYTEAKIIILKNYVFSLIRHLTLPAVSLSVLGIIYGLRKARGVTIALVIAFLLSGPFFITYTGFPISDFFVLGIAERFYILSYALLLTFVPLGMEALYSFFNNVFSKKMYAKILIATFLLVPFFMLIKNYQKTNLSQTELGTVFARDHFRNLPKGSLLFLTGDTRSFNSWYTYYVLKYRNDIDIVQIGDFGFDNKFFNSLREKIRLQTGFDGNELFINTLLAASNEKKIYSMIEIQVPKERYRWLSLGLVYQLFEIEKLPTKAEYSKLVEKHLENVIFPFEESLMSVETSLIHKSILTYYSSAAVNIGSTYLSQYKDKTAAQLYFQKAIFVQPTFSESYAGYARLRMQEGKCEDAERNIKKAISYYPVGRDYYALWYRVAESCFKNEEKMENIQLQFSLTFRQDLLKIVDQQKKNEIK